MDHVSLKKKLSTYLSETGRLRNVSEELRYEVLTSWEQWTGTAKDFYKSIGFTQKQMAKRNKRGQARNKLYQIARKKPHKATKIYQYNLGRQKLEKQYEGQKELVRNIAFQAAHPVVDQAKEVRTEDLTKPFASKTKWKAYNRKMSAWAKGSLACTSQMDSKTGRLEGRRVGDKFYHVNGEVSQADTNAAVNIKQRADDPEISLYTSYREVKAILLHRLTADGGVSGSQSHDRPSRTPVTSRKRTLTESEQLQNFWQT